MRAFRAGKRLKYLYLSGSNGGEMRSVRKGLRAGEIEKDTYDRLTCAACGVSLTKRDDPAELGMTRKCPECGREWEQVK